MNVKLRPLSSKDAPYMLEWMTDPEITRFFRFDAANVTEASCREYIDNASKQDNAVHFAIADENDEYLGTISLKDIDTENRCAEYAISTRKKAHGTGAATQATEQILRYAFETLGLDRVYLNVLAENGRANAFYRKAGFRFVREEPNALELRGEPKTLNWYEIMSSDKKEQSNTESGEIAVSVAVITYNLQKYLPKLLDSILEQKTTFRYEIVVDDDCSPDDSREILREYDKRYPGVFVLSFRNENVKASKNLHGVMRQCRGKYIALLEGDDWWDDPEKLQYQYDFMEKHPEYIGMYCNSWVETSLTEVKHYPRRDISEPLVFTFKDFKNTHFFDRMPNSTDTAFFRNFYATAPAEEVDVFWKAHPMVADQTLALILYGKGPVYVDPRIVSHHRSITDKNANNYQALYAREDHRVSDAYMYACHEEYIEKVLHRRCGRFYKVRGDIFAQTFWSAKKNHSASEKAKAKEIWNQRRKKWPLVWWTFVWGCGTIKRKLTKKRT